MLNLNSLLELYRTLRRYYYQNKISRPFAVKLFNHQIFNPSTHRLESDSLIEDHWLFQFIAGREYLKDSKKTLSIFGVNGDKLAIYLNKSDFKVFYSIENVHVKSSPWIKYEDMLIENSNIDLSLGFDYLVHEKYLRFPYWLMAVFSPLDTYETIKRKCEQLNVRKNDIERRNKFCSFICREDYFGDRKFFAEEISRIDKISCPGKFMHNDDDLKLKYNNLKTEYLKNFKFNLCPENSDSRGYVTEKLFDSISAGCIPIYWGSGNSPEPDILNEKAILFLELHGNNESTLNEIREINRKPALYKEFINQDKLNKEAPELIYQYFNQLDKKLRILIK